MMQFFSIGEQEWDSLTVQSPYAACFHRNTWRKAVLASFGGETSLMGCRVQGKDWILPIFSGGRWSTGFRIGSIGYGGPLPLFSLSKGEDALQQMRLIMGNLEKELGKKCTGYTAFPLPLWDGAPLSRGEFLSYTQILSLGPDPASMFQTGIGGKVRTAVRRARKGGVSVRKIRLEEAPQAHGLLIVTQKHVGASYTTPYCFFEELVQQSGRGVETWGGFDESGQMVAMATMLYTGSDSRIGRWQGGSSDFWTGASGSALEHGASEVEKFGAKPTLPEPTLESRAVYTGSDARIEKSEAKPALAEPIPESLPVYAKKSAFHLFHGWDREKAPIGTNQALLWEMVAYSIQKGMQEFNFGESHQESLRRAKEEWKAAIVPVLKGAFL